MPAAPPTNTKLVKQVSETYLTLNHFLTAGHLNIIREVFIIYVYITPPSTLLALSLPSNKLPLIYQVGITERARRKKRAYLENTYIRIPTYSIQRRTIQILLYMVFL